MTEGNTRTAALLLGSDGRGVFLRARGSIRAVLCFSLRERLLAPLEAGEDIHSVFVDLSECTYMDSTFIGLLVAIDRLLRKPPGGRLHLVRPSARCIELLGEIGLQDILHVQEKEVAFPAVLEELGTETGTPGAEFVLRAHEVLMETTDEARRKFALLKETLERALRSKKPPGDTP